MSNTRILCRNLRLKQVYIRISTFGHGVLSTTAFCYHNHRAPFKSRRLEREYACLPKAAIADSQTIRRILSKTVHTATTSTQQHRLTDSTFLRISWTHGQRVQRRSVFPDAALLAVLYILAARRRRELAKAYVISTSSLI